MIFESAHPPHTALGTGMHGATKQQHYPLPATTITRLTNCYSHHTRTCTRGHHNPHARNGTWPFHPFPSYRPATSTTNTTTRRPATTTTPLSQRHTANTPP